MTAEEGPCTRYLRSLDPQGEPPDVESFDSVLEELRRILGHELRRRGLSQLPPSYLGVHGHPRWTTGRSGCGDALDELTLDCYGYIFVDRVRPLRAHLRLKPNVDGLVFLNVGHFVHERQKRHDPLGTRLFAILRSAVSRSVEEGDTPWLCPHGSSSRSCARADWRHRRWSRPADSPRASVPRIANQ